MYDRLPDVGRPDVGRSRPQGPPDQPVRPPPSATAREAGEAGFPGLRVLIVEDEFFVALATEEMVTDLGCTVVATAPDFRGAVQAVNGGGFDVALLDINLNDEDVYPVAEQLIERGVPFLFVTGYADKDLPERFRALPRIQKPLDRRQLEAWLRAIFTD